MMDPITPPSMPYRKQETRWTCAASLRMVYASFGLELSEAELWDILKPIRTDRSGVESSRLAWGGPDSWLRGPRGPGAVPLGPALDLLPPRGPCPLLISLYPKVPSFVISRSWPGSTRPGCPARPTIRARADVP